MIRDDVFSANQWETYRVSEDEVAQPGRISGTSHCVGGSFTHWAGWALTIMGFLADPKYGGNRDFTGWKVAHYPGPSHHRGSIHPKKCRVMSRSRLFGTRAS